MLLLYRVSGRRYMHSPAFTRTHRSYFLICGVGRGPAERDQLDRGVELAAAQRNCAHECASKDHACSYSFFARLRGRSITTHDSHDFHDNYFFQSKPDDSGHESNPDSMGGWIKVRVGSCISSFVRTRCGDFRLSTSRFLARFGAPPAYRLLRPPV